MLKQTLNGILAGILIIIGCSVFLACEVNYVGAVMFAVALLCICYKGYSLFTGKVGYLAESCKKQDISIVLTALLGNLIGTFLFGLMVSYALPNLQEKAFAICSAKLTQTVPVAFIRAIFCGGKTVGRLYETHIYPLTTIPAIVLPSTSPANAACTDAMLLDAWSAILPYLM